MNCDYLFKILVIGDSGVGKSSILSQYVDKVFSDTHISTIGVDFKISTIKIDDHVIKLQIWDTAGQERFRNITTSYYRGAQGVLVVYDVTSIESFTNVVQWLLDIKRYCTSNYNVLPAIIMVGNKTDIPNNRKVSTGEATLFAINNNIMYIETSAKTNLNINKLFTKLASEIKVYKLNGGNGNDSSEIKNGVDINNIKLNNSKCC